MRKEVILAIIIGVILGGIILYGLKIAQQSATENQATLSAQTKDTDNIITPTPTPEILITISSPADHSVSFTSTVSVKGQTKPSTTVAITSESTDSIVTSDSSGNFSAEISLIGGENNILATSVFPDLSTASAKISIIYTTSQIEN